jgi:HEAT repeat protein
MRVQRALEKLHWFFNRRGLSSTTAIIAGEISAHSLQVAPAGLAATISTVAIAKGAAAGGSTLTLVKGALKIMAWTKAKLAIVVVSGLIMATGVSVVVVEKASLIQGKTESEWIKSIVYFGDDNQTKLWRSLGPKGIQMLVRALKSPPNDRDTRMRAASLLDQLGRYDNAKSAIPELIKLIQTEKIDSVRGIELGFFEGPIESMSEKDKAALFPELLRAMESEDSSVRNNALVALQYYPKQTDTVIPLMVKSLKDSNLDVRVMAVKALSKIDPQNTSKSDLVPVLIGCLADTEGAANEAVRTLGELHRDANLAVPALIRSLQSEKAYIRNNSAAALGRFGGQARPAIPALEKALNDSDPTVRRLAADSLKRINSGALPK